MIRSMTGFGSATIDNEIYKIVVELKSINHRFSDIHLRLPKELNKYEIEIRQTIKKYLIRGKLDVNIKFILHQNSNKFMVDESLLDNYISVANDVSTKYNIEKLNDPIKLILLPNVLIEAENEFDEDKLLNDLNEVLKQAFVTLDSSRLQEGEILSKDILDKMSEIDKIVEYIDSISDDFISTYKQRMLKNFDELFIDRNLSQERIMIEAGILADKICIDEEIVRLRSHISQTRLILNGNLDEVGRKLDFILQEFNRESNTILSKSIDIDVTNSGLELKSIIEKIREQVQNLI